jgi:cytochrome c
LKKLLFGVLVIALFAAAPVHADASLDLAKEKNCLSCHTLNVSSRYAPSFRSIAKKYSNQGDAEAVLVETVMKGSPDTGGYHWGTMPEPGPGGRQPVSQAEARQLVQWILGMK